MTSRKFSQENNRLERKRNSSNGSAHNHARMLSKSAIRKDVFRVNVYVRVNIVIYSCLTLSPYARGPETLSGGQIVGCCFRKTSQRMHISSSRVSHRSYQGKRLSLGSLLWGYRAGPCSFFCSLFWQRREQRNVLGRAHVDAAVQSTSHTHQSTEKRIVRVYSGLQCVSR